MQLPVVVLKALLSAKFVLSSFLEANQSLFNANATPLSPLGEDIPRQGHEPRKKEVSNDHSYFGIRCIKNGNT